MKIKMNTLTFEEWDNYVFPMNGVTNKDLFNIARQGMIPAENAITLPPESMWPKWARSIRIEYSKSDCADSESYIKDIFRTKPQPITMTKAEALAKLSEVMGKPVVIEE